jgi:undecaprenol kinase/diacylglycerol kinase (ATP)
MVIGLVFITELLNSAVESLADYINPEWNELIKKAKDYSAAAVLISAIISVIIGAIIFIPKISDLIFTSSVIK